MLRRGNLSTSKAMPPETLKTNRTKSMDPKISPSEILFSLASGGVVQIEETNSGALVSRYENEAAFEACEPSATEEFRTAAEVLESLGTVPDEVRAVLRSYTVGDGVGGDQEYEADNIAEALENAADWASDGDWGTGRSYLRVSATDWAGYCESTEVVVGEEPKAPVCEHSEDGEHDWQSPYEIVGGIRENPGVWSVRGTQMRFMEVCAGCGLIKETLSESTPGDYPRQPETITYEDATEESEAWAAEQRGEWTEAQAREYVAAHDDDDSLDEDDLERAFAAMFGRKPDADERAEGLWSHLCAAVE